MDNLEQLWHQSVKINHEEYGKCVSCSSSEQLACFITDKNCVCIYEHTNPDNPLIQRIKGKHLKYIYCLAVHDVIFLATDQELILYDRHTLQYNVCYISEEKIVALAWNPSETAVVVIDEAEKIYLCNFATPSFESQYSSDLNAEVPSSVYVGWGSEDTQFQGPKRQRTMKEKVPLVGLEYKPPNISWRGNGQLLAINFFRNGQRFIKVFDNELNALHVLSEYHNLMEPLTFMVAGQCIACTTSGRINTIVILEKNCKMKSTFEVPENKGTIVRMQYHPQMNMLAVYSLDKEKYGYVNIYLYTNGEWLLKQQLYFPPNRIVQDFQWTNLHEPLYTICRLVIFTNQSIEYYTFRFIINRCPLTSVVALVDGRDIVLYNFSEKTIPPPMAYFQVTHSRPINKIVFHPRKLLCVALDSAMRAMVIDVEKNEILLTSDELDLTNAPLLRNIVCSEDEIQIDVEDCSSEIMMTLQEHDSIRLKINFIKGPSSVGLPYNDTDCLVSYRNLNADESTLIYLTKKVLLVNNDEIDLDFAFSSNRELYLNKQVICNGVTSFIIFRNYLLLTTVTCKLYCVRLLQDYNTLLSDRLNLDKTYSREIEQGARIVVASDIYPPQITMVLPRGNLETIRCRLLNVDMIEELLSGNDWEIAVDIMKNERMNWNLLIDLNPERFLDHIEDFVKAAEYSTSISMIVNDFTNKITFYENCLPNVPQKRCDKSEIVTEIVNYLTSVDLINNLSSIVSIQHKHFSLKSALNCIRMVFELDPHSNESVCQDALQSLSTKGHFKDIIEATYALHSIDFLVFVYHNSTEDPRIYEPEIAEYRTLNPVEVKFKMSLKGNDLNEAVKYLLRCDNYDRAFIQTFILKHKLEDAAYKNLPPFYEHFVTISVLFAKCLSLKQKHDEAAVVLKRANLIPEAFEEYKEALDWREVLNIMTFLHYDEDEQKKVLYYVSNKLSSAGRVDEAVLLLDKYNGDYVQAVQVFVEHKMFRKAICMAKEHDAEEILNESIIPSLKSYMSDLKDKINEFESTFKKYFNRLQLLREEKKNKLDNAALGVYEGDDDLYSDSGSTTSSYGSSRATSRSRSSQLSSRSRRKEDRKKIDLREGGYYEDIALIRALHILYKDVFALGKDVREVCFILDHDDFQLAKSIHADLSGLQDLMKEHTDLIWPDVFLNVPQFLDNTGLAIIENKADLDPMYCVPPGENILSDEWKLDMFS